ncbi:mannosyltransferase B [Candidatus Moduliflexus flocculans]|uniref:Mannosyltransferase B n=1 Tax=Candidatus Moduliflexus flocculans TaxID=1499966 RepID=A0A081BMW2_9BACT|nr:mannosyltransferase B [Candidatus Moduliflexus flocculans]
MKIGIDARSLFGTPTGVGRYVANILDHLRSLDRENTYRLYTDRPEAAFPFAQANFQPTPLTLPVAQNYFTWLHLRLPPELLRRPVDIFHFPFYTMPIIRNYKTIVTLHDITFEVHPEWYSWKGRVATRPFARYAACHADVILTDSNSSKQDILRYYHVADSKVTVIPLGVETRFARIEDRERKEAIRAKYHVTWPQMVLYVGSIHTRRNIESLIRAFQHVCRTNQDVCLMLVGKREYPYLDLPRLIDETGLREHIVCPGYVADDDLPILYNIADVFVYPSSYEGFGLPPLEAMACGTPVMTCNNTSLPEVVGDAAIFVDPLNIAEMADAMRLLLNDGSLRQNLSEKGIRRASAFSWKRTAQETLAVYQRLM